MSNLAKQYPNGYKEKLPTEMIGGVIYAMAPVRFTHQKTERNIHNIFDRHLKGKSCEAVHDMYLSLSDEDLFIPDIMIICNRDYIESARVVGPPDLVVEILSRSTKKRDKTLKKDTYEKFGVKEYWLVDADGRDMEVYVLIDGKYKLDGVYTVYDEFDLEELAEQGLEPVYEFKTSIFDDLIIKIEDVFEGL